MSDQARRRSAPRLEQPLQPDPEVEVGELRLAVGPPRAVVALEVRVAGVDGAAHVVGGARDADDPRGVRPQQRRHQQRGEGAVAEVVRAELHLEPVGGPALGDAHHAGVVDEDVDRAVRGEDPGRRLADRRLRAEVELDQLERRVGHPGRMSATAPAALSWSRAAITTWAPAPASARAVSSPSPPFAPVTTAVDRSGRGYRPRSSPPRLLRLNIHSKNEDATRHRTGTRVGRPRLSGLRDDPAGGRARRSCGCCRAAA